MKKKRANDQQEAEKALVGAMAAEMVETDMAIGLGTGSTVRHFAQALGQRIRMGLRVRVICTSRQSEMLAKQNDIPTTDFDRARSLDLCVDGADEVSLNFDMIKGGGGALLYEKIVAAASNRRIYMADATKLVGKLGEFPLPVEICRFGHQNVLSHLAKLAQQCALRQRDGDPVITDAGNYIADCQFGEIDRPAELHRQLCDIPGVVETGLFCGMIDTLITIRNGKPVVLTSPGEVFWGS
ncbi:ribose-5-phosphate isomerase RpiA [Dongia soli]|uniref:Ribose-5-phosphate isomerase A n=1 Tax=Dongia soli TaxID=600628 RepID=A0ABU5EID1_9PROT|nr:ribose-5-phosphate isomerase RpiA [Dongia soli]MDY0885594.1 ribose-5-phosphate isomerase RpiA [Dongia soli]